MSNGFNMIALNFQPLDGTEEIAIKDLVQNKTDLISAAAQANADQIQVWNGSKMEVYFYRAYKATPPNQFTLGPAWVKVGAISKPTEETVVRGSGIWFVRPDVAAAKGVLCLSGSVNAAEATHDVTAGFNMLSSAFPVNLALNNGVIDWTKYNTIAAAAQANADQIQTWNGNSMDVYFYRAYKATPPNQFTLGPAWVKVGAISKPTEEEIPAGRGFWYVRPDGKASSSFKEPSPIAK